MSNAIHFAHNLCLLGHCINSANKAKPAGMHWLQYLDIYCWFGYFIHCHVLFIAQFPNLFEMEDAGCIWTCSIWKNNILHPYNEYTPIGENPSCLQATLASVVSQKSSHTVPHWLMLHISTRPSRGLCPLWSLISPYAHITEMKNTDSYNYKTSIEFIQFYNMFIFFLRNWLYKRGWKLV